MHAEELSERVVRARSDRKEFEALLAEYRPFVLSAAGKTCGRFVDFHDDEASVGLIAFEEAVRRFDPETGRFLPFAERVIRSRIIDHLRVERRSAGTVPLDEPAEDEDGSEAPNDRLRYRNSGLWVGPMPRSEDPVRLEVLALARILEPYGISFRDLVRCSPKAGKTREACGRAARAIASDPALLGAMRKTRTLPLARLDSSEGVPRKTAERHRKYIVCLAEILSGEFSHLAGYVRSEGKGEGR
jgi:RNA polymerase sigma factor